MDRTDPTGRFAAEGFAIGAIISTLAHQHIASLNPIVQGLKPIIVNTEVFVREGSDTWNATSAFEVVQDARAIWASTAGIQFNASRIRTIPADPTNYLVPALEPAYGDARRFVDQFATAKHVTVLVEKPRIVTVGRLGPVTADATVLGKASFGQEGNGRGYAFIGAVNGRVVAHEWGHTLLLRDNEEPLGLQNLMRQNADGSKLTERQSSLARGFATVY